MNYQNPETDVEIRLEYSDDGSYAVVITECTKVVAREDFSTMIAAMTRFQEAMASDIYIWSTMQEQEST